MENVDVNIHSSICINGDLYFDPFRTEEKKHNAKVIFITHSHYDHLDKQSIINVANKDTKFVCPNDCYETILDLGFERKNIFVLAPGQKLNIDDLSVESFSAYNINKPFHKKENGWLGYLVTIDNVRYCICGDTDLTEELKKIECDVLFLPIGGTYTMNATEAIDCVNFIKPKIAIPVHYGSIVGSKKDEEIFKKGNFSDTKIVIKIK